MGSAAVAPVFDVDPLWPKPLPNGWVLGPTIGVAVDASDNVWIIHRPGSRGRQLQGRGGHATGRHVLHAGAAGPRSSIATAT